MPQNLFVVGDVVDLGDVLEKRGGAGGGLPPGLVSIGAQARSVVRVSSPARTQLTWLPYVPGYTNVVKSNGLNVLSGPFTGCYMIKFMLRGEAYTGHVATPEAKTSWNQFAQGLTNNDIVRGFKPANHLMGANTTPVISNDRRNGDSALRIFGLITSTSELYTIVGFSQIMNGIQMPTVHRIAYISQKVAPLAPPQLRNLV